MNLYKRITLFLLLLSMTTAVLPVMAQNTDSNIDTVSLEFYDENLHFLTSLGIYSFSEENPENTVSRGAFAKMLTDLLGMDSNENAADYFTDVTPEYEYNREVGLVASLKIMNGVGGGCFLPQEPITYRQAIKTIVNALGYEPAAEATGGYADGYLRCAYELGILKNPPYDYDAPLSFEKAADLIALATDAEVFDTFAIKGKDAYYASMKGMTVLGFYHRIFIDEGLMSDNGITALNKKSQTGIGGSIIGKRRLYGTDECEGAFLGYYVEYYYRAENSELLYVSAKKGRNDVVTVKAKDLALNSSEFSKTCLVTKIDSKKRNYKIDRYANLIYNGALDETFTVNTLKIKDGTITLIDADRDSVYETVIAEEYSDIILGNCNVNNKKITAKYSTTEYANFNYGEYKCAIFQNAQGQSINPEEIPAESVLSVFKSKGKEKIRFVVSAVKDDIVADRVKTDSTGTIFVYYGETCYEFSSTYKELMKGKPGVYKKPESGTAYQLFLNYEGNIAMLTETQGKLQYAYILKAGRRGDGLYSDMVEVMLHLESNDSVVVPVAEKLTLDGVKNKSGEDILSSKDLYDSLTGNFKPQIVMVRINAAGELKELDIATDNTNSKFGFDLSEFSMDYAIASSTGLQNVNNVRTIRGGHAVGEKTIGFLIHNRSTTLETTDEDIVEVIDYNQMKNIGSGYFAKLYDADESWTAAAAVFSDPGDFSSRLFIVSETFIQINDDGEDCNVINGWFSQDFQSLIERENGVLYDAVITRYPGSDGNIYPGDLFEITRNIEDEIIKARLIYSPQRDTDPDYCFFDMNGQETINHDNTMYILGYPCYVSADRIGTYSKANASYTTVSGKNTPSNEQYWTTVLTAASTISVFEFNCETQELTEITAADIPSAAQLTANGYENFNTDTKVLIKRVDGRAYDVIVITNMGANYR